jgi:TolB-like protein
MDAGSAGEQAARWFVRVDAGESGADRELTSWLERPENERALERVELAVALGQRLSTEPGSALHVQAAEAARRVPRGGEPARALAWGGALAAAAVAAVLLVRGPSPAVHVPAPVALRAAQRAAVDPPTSAVAVLPTGAVVDASTVAVLPFAAAREAALAEGLRRDVVEALLTVPGLYVIGDAAVTSYAATDLSPSEIGAQLGARGIVDAGIELVDGRVRVNARLQDAATGATLWRADLDRPVDELRAVRIEIAEHVAGAMLDPSLRAPARTDASALAVGKPFLQ